MRVARVFAIAVLLCLTGLSTGHAQNNGPSYVVSYIEVVPSARNSTRALLRKLRNESRREAGNSSFEILQRIDRPQHFAILETWKDAKSQADHAASVIAKQVQDKLKAVLVAPYDDRPSFAFEANSSGPPGKSSIYAVTHVDFVGVKKDEGLAALKQLSGDTVKEPGLLRYDVLQQSSRVNHVTLVEIWRNISALEAHERAEPSRKFREALRPIGGALYDQRLYRAIN
jgi:quinol monooxygenase YgiN